MKKIFYFLFVIFMVLGFLFNVRALENENDVVNDTFLNDLVLKDPEDFGLTFFVNGKDINETLMRKAFIEIPNYSKVYLGVRSTMDNVEITTPMGLMEIKSGTNILPITVKTSEEEYTYNLTIIGNPVPIKESFQRFSIFIVIGFIILTGFIFIIADFFKNKNSKIMLGSFIIIIVLFVLLNIGGVGTVNGNSMESTLHNGDFLLLKKAFNKYKNGDLVIFKNDQKIYLKDDQMVKRIIGIPGDVIEIKNNQLFVNDVLQEENYINEAMNTFDMKVTLNDNEYFVMGDNRNDSLDSRVLGPINEEQILYKAYPIG